MQSLKFVAAAMIGAVVLLAADQYASESFFQLGSFFPGGLAGAYGGNKLYKVFAWLCMSAAVLAVTPSQRRWGTALVSGLALSVAYMELRELALTTMSSGSYLFGQVAALVLFAIPVWLIWLWFKGVAGEKRAA